MFKNKTIVEFIEGFKGYNIPRDLDEYNKLDLNKDMDFRGAMIFNVALAAEKLAEAQGAIMEEKFRTMQGDVADKAGQWALDHMGDIYGAGIKLVAEARGNPTHILEGAWLLASSEIGEWLKAYINGKHLADKGGNLSVLTELANKVDAKLIGLGLGDIPLGTCGMTVNRMRAIRAARKDDAECLSGTGLLSVIDGNGKRATSTASGAGGEFIPSVFIAVVIEEGKEWFPLQNRFRFHDVGGSTGKVPRKLTGYTAYGRNEGSSGTGSDLITDDIDYTTKIRTIMTTPTRELMGESAPGINLQQIILGSIAHARAEDIKAGYISGANSGNDSMTGLKTSADAGYTYTEAYASSIRQTMIKAINKLGGEKNDWWEDNAVIVAAKSVRSAYFDQLAALPEAATFIHGLRSMKNLNVLGAPFEKVWKVPAGTAFINVPEEYVFVEVGAHREMIIDTTGYTLQTQRKVLFMMNYEIDGFTTGEELTAGNETWYPIVHVTGIPVS